MNKIKIAGVVVLFHPKMDELNQNIYSYIEYVDVLFVVVNSKFDKYYSAFLDIESAVKINNIWYIRNK